MQNKLLLGVNILADKPITKKTRIQVQVDADLKKDVDEVLSHLGMTPTAAITLLYKRIVATNSYPVDLSLTEDEKERLSLIEDAKKLPIRTINTKEEAEQWLNQHSDDEY